MLYRMLETALKYDKSESRRKRRTARLLWKLLYLYTVTAEKRLKDVHVAVPEGGGFPGLLQEGLKRFEQER